jgi:hypothetical protein
MNKRFNNKRKSKAKASMPALSSTPEMSLSGFKPVMWPVCLPVKLIYTDYRVLTAVANQANYVYRLNSLFDPDQSGVGGQPAGFDQLKTLYGRYRVLACKCEVEAVSNSTGGNGLLAIAPSDISSLTAVAEDIAGLRYAAAATFSQSEKARLVRTYHIGKLLGYGDESMLGNPDAAAATTASPNFQQYLNVNVETGNGATNQTMVMVRLTYYARMEVPTAVEDATPLVHMARSFRFMSGAPVAQRASPTNAPENSDTPEGEPAVSGTGRIRGAPAPIPSSTGGRLASPSSAATSAATLTVNIEPGRASSVSVSQSCCPRCIRSEEIAGLGASLPQVP